MNREFTLGSESVPEPARPQEVKPQETRKSHWGLVLFLLLLLLGLLVFMATLFISARTTQQLPTSPPEATQFLKADIGHGAKSISPADIPPWLMMHVAIIGTLQIISVLCAARVASRESLTKRDGRLVLFLCEIPMYLGLFGTLLGVCLTQFIAGSLVAPLAYFSTMGGVLLHVLGKLTIWLRLPEELIERE